MNIWSISGLSPDLSSSLSPLTIFLSFVTSSPIFYPLFFFSLFLAPTTTTALPSFSSSEDEEEDDDD
jgi:hypothetical protein